METFVTTFYFKKRILFNPYVSQSEHILMGTKLLGEMRPDYIIRYGCSQLVVVGVPPPPSCCGLHVMPFRLSQSLQPVITVHSLYNTMYKIYHGSPAPPPSTRHQTVRTDTLPLYIICVRAVLTYIHTTLNPDIYMWALLGLNSVCLSW